MHGLGADGHDFEPIVPMLRCPRVRFVFPNAPAMPVTLNGGMIMPAWYDIRTLEPNDERESEDDIRRSAAAIESLIDRERDLGVPSERIVVAGFSQGAAMALFTALRYPRPLGGVIVLSGYPLLPHTFAAEGNAANRNTPIFFGHGRLDSVVPIEGGRRACELTRSWSAGALVWNEFPIAHEVSVEEIEAIGAWLRERFAG
jgi:phospholipase/carboxylesterase